MLFDEAGGARKRKDIQAARQVGVCLEVPTEIFFGTQRIRLFIKQNSRDCFFVFFLSIPSDFDLCGFIWYQFLKTALKRN